MKRHLKGSSIAIGILGLLVFFQNCGRIPDSSTQQGSGKFSSELESVNQSQLSVMPKLKADVSTYHLKRILLTVVAEDMQAQEVEWLPQAATDVPPASLSILVTQGQARHVGLQMEFVDEQNKPVVFYGENLVNLSNEQSQLTLALEQIL